MAGRGHRRRSGHGPGRRASDLRPPRFELGHGAVDVIRVEGDVKAQLAGVVDLGDVEDTQFTAVVDEPHPDERESVAAGLEELAAAASEVSSDLERVRHPPVAALSDTAVDAGSAIVVDVAFGHQATCPGLRHRSGWR